MTGRGVISKKWYASVIKTLEDLLDKAENEDVIINAMLKLNELIKLRAIFLPPVHLSIVDGLLLTDVERHYHSDGVDLAETVAEAANRTARLRLY